MSRPLRVVVIANSAALVVAVRAPEAEKGPYPLLLADLLAVNGVPAEVRNCSRVMGMVNEGVRDWERAAWNFWPDLIVFQYGVQECYSGLFPRAVHRQAWKTQHSGRPLDRKLTKLLQTRWSFVQRASQKLDRPWMPGQMSQARFRHQFNELVRLSMGWTGAAVVAVGMHPPNFRLMKLSGAYPARRARLQPIIEEAVAENPRCGFVDFQRVLDAVDPDFEKVMPDGLHLAQDGHVALASLIAQEYKLIRSRLDTLGPDADQALEDISVRFRKSLRGQIRGSN